MPVNSWSSGGQLHSRELNSKAAAENMLREQGFRLGPRGGWQRSGKNGSLVYASVTEMPSGKWRVHQVNRSYGTPGT